MYLRQKLLISTLALCSFILLPEMKVFADIVPADSTGIVSAKVLNLRKSPNTTSKILAKIKSGEKVKIISSSEEWHKVSYNKMEGWVFHSYIEIQKPKEEIGIVNVNILRVRKGPSTSANVVSKIEKGKTFQILDASKNWYKINTEDGITGWVCGDYIVLKKNTEERKDKITISRGGDKEIPKKSEEKPELDEEKPKLSDSEEIPKDKVSELEKYKDEQLQVDNEKNNPEQELKKEEPNNIESGASLSQQIVDYAKTFIGVNYKYGGENPTDGFDCSGFTKYVFSNFKINLERTALSQSCQGIQVNKEELKIGDLVFFDTSGKGQNINHVGIYIGDNNFVHAASPQYDVTITNLLDAYYLKTYVTSRRILTE